MKSIYYTAIPLSVAAVIHLLPLPGMFGGSALERHYGFRIERGGKKDDDGSGIDSRSAGLLIALQHRAIMLGSFGVALAVGTFWHPPSLHLAIGTTLVSDVSFLAFAIPKWRRLNAKMKRVMYADMISIVCLGIAATARE